MIFYFGKGSSNILARLPSWLADRDVFSFGPLVVDGMGLQGGFFDL